MCWEGLSPLSPFIGHPDPKVRRIVYIDYLHSTHPSAVLELQQLLENEQDLILRANIKSRVRALEEFRASSKVDGSYEKPDKLEWDTTSLKSAKKSFKTAWNDKNVSLIPLMKEALNKYNEPLLKACYLRLCALMEFDYFEDIRKHLEDEDPRVVNLTCDLLNSLASSKSLASLLPVLGHSAIVLRKRVSQILIGHGYDFLSILLRDVIKVKPDLAGIVMGFSINCASSLNSKRGSSILIRLLSDRDPTISSVSKEAFKEVYQTFPKAIHRRLNLILNEQSGFNLAEIIAFRGSFSKVPAKSKKIDPEDHPSVKSSTDHTDLVDQMRGLASSEESDQKKLRIFMNYLHHPAARVRLAALEWLGSGLPNSLVPVLVPILQDEDVEVRYTAAQIILKRDQNSLTHEAMILDCIESLINEGQEALAQKLLKEQGIPKSRDMASKLADLEHTLPEIEDVSDQSDRLKRRIYLPQKSRIFSDPNEFLLSLEEVFQQGSLEQKSERLEKILNYEVILDEEEAMLLLRRLILMEQNSGILSTLFKTIGHISTGDEWDLLEPFLSSQDVILRKAAVRTLSQLGDLRVLPHVMEVLDQDPLTETDYEILEYSFEILNFKRPDLGILVLSRIFIEKHTQWQRIRRILERWEFPPTDLNKVLIMNLENNLGGGATNYIFNFLRKNGGRWDVPNLVEVRRNSSDPRLKDRIKELEVYLQAKGSQNPNPIREVKVQDIRWVDMVSWKWVLPSMALSAYLIWARFPTNLELEFYGTRSSEHSNPQNRNDERLEVKGPFWEVLFNPGWIQTLHQNRIVFIQADYEEGREVYRGVITHQGPYGSLYLKPD